MVITTTINRYSILELKNQLLGYNGLCAHLTIVMLYFDVILIPEH